MLYLKSILGLVAISLFCCCSCKQKAEEQPKGSFPEGKDSLADQVHDSIPRVAVYSSTDYGISWLPMSEGLPVNLQATAIEKVGHELVLASSNAGLFMTEQHKSKWKDIGTGLATKNINTVYVVGDEIYIGLNHQGVTMWKLNTSYWTSYNNNLPNRNVLAILKMKDELVIGTDMGIFKSSDHIQTWTGKYIGETVFSLIMTGDTLYAGTVKGVLISKDGGENWSYIHKGGVVHALALQNKILFAQYTSGDLFRSENWGKSWDPINYSPREQSFLYHIVAADDNLLMSNNYGVFRSKNGGSDWLLIYPQKEYAFVDFTADDHVVYGTTRK
jgi:hypothetical protein